MPPQDFAILAMVQSLLGGSTAKEEPLLLNALARRLILSGLAVSPAGVFSFTVPFLSLSALSSGVLNTDLLFTDATFDIGKTGATRPRDGFFSRSVTVGTTLAVGTTLTISGLIDASGAAAGQLKFPSTQNPSADANTLDDYREGNWTPIDASGAALSLTVVVAKYTKIGKMVFFTAQVSYPVTADGSAAKIGGLPFTVTADGTANDRYPFTAGAATVYRFIRVGSTNIENYLASGASYTNAQFSNTTHYFSGVYEAS